MLHLTRRFFLAAAAAASAFPWPSPARDRKVGARERLWYARPAARWEEALPIGNGRLGAMVFGRVAQERLQLNEDTLWAGSPYTPDNPEALEAIPEVRRLLQAKRYREATALASAKVMAKPLQQMSYGSLGDILLTFADAEVPTHYERSLDLATAIARTRYRTNAGAVTRHVFASSPRQVIVMRLAAPKGKLSFDLAYRAPRRVQYTSPEDRGLATPLPANGPIDWLAMESAGELPPDVRASADGEACLLIMGRNEAGPETPAGLTFALRVKIVADGRVAAENGRMSVRDARTAVLLIGAATSYVSYEDVSADPVAIVRRQTDDAAREPYDALESEHIREYRALYASTSIELPATSSAEKPTDLRIAAAETSDDPALAALYFQFARYLLIASSRPGCQPANLQGIWNEGVNPPWGSKYTININTEMNYWPADPAGLGACVEPLLRMVEELAVTGARTAKTMYGARGWVAHHNTDLWRAAAPIDGPLWGLWPCGGAWLCNALWDHYDYSRDEHTLRRLYPLMRDACLFFLDTLVEDPAGRGLVTSPSLSPENLHPFGSALCIGPAMDRQIVRDLFAHTIEAGKTLGLDAELLAQLDATARRIAPDAIGKSGQLQEWLEDWDDMAPEPHHRHVSHLYAAYPSSQINVRDTPALIEAAKTSLRRRGDLATGWGTAWRLCLWARMGEGDHAHAILKTLLGPQRTYPNLFDAHPPFQIDGNFGGAAGILEMLVQSWGGEIRVLPALPSAWPRGEARGIRVRGAMSVSLGWRRHTLKWLELTGPPRQRVTLRYGGTSRVVVLDARGRYRI
ncbi:MAG TPA: glycoside hydrolase family 95 protein [Steroidobacteraceae bacterium]|nr:glycoside hydrolase family 95 protein [Steroidobacteraceae bacterium]